MITSTGFLCLLQLLAQKKLMILTEFVGEKTSLLLLNDSKGRGVSKGGYIRGIKCFE